MFICGRGFSFIIYSLPFCYTAQPVIYFFRILSVRSSVKSPFTLMLPLVITEFKHTMLLVYRQELILVIFLYTENHFCTTVPVGKFQFFQLSRALIYPVALDQRSQRPLTEIIQYMTRALHSTHIFSFSLQCFFDSHPSKIDRLLHNVF